MKHCPSVVIKISLLVAWIAAFCLDAVGQSVQDKMANKRNLRDIQCDLTVPKMELAKPAPGRRVKISAPGFEKTDVYHCLFLPNDWNDGQKFPVIVEYAGNGTYRNQLGDICNGLVEECSLGYGMSGGKGFIWICLPFVSKDKQQNQLRWWGDVEATKSYCRVAVNDVCARFGGDPGKVILAGFSRGAIACNYIGLHDDSIASLWCGFVCHSHYDGTSDWAQGVDRLDAAKRLGRLGDRPQFISHELSVDKTRTYLAKNRPGGKFTFQVIPYPNHTDTWVLRDLPQRKALRDWLQDVIRENTD